MKTIVVSGITLRKGGTLAILRETLAYLSGMAGKDWRVVALVNKRELCDYPNIEYIEVPLKGWMGRLWYEYVTMGRISRELGPVYLWISMHDVTPRVKAKYQAVYYQTSFPFYRWKWRDFRFDPKIPVFAMLTKFYYRAFARRNRYIIVQQEWLRNGIAKLIDIDRSKIIVAPPQRQCNTVSYNTIENECTTFFYASTPDCHKNFETLCEAARILERKNGTGRFKVVITIKGEENRYAQWLHKKWGDVKSISFYGLMDKTTLYSHYAAADCFVFPSNIETWGLPITEYMETKNGPMILNDLPYAHSTAAGSPCTAFFKPDNAADLASLMQDVLDKKYSRFEAIPENKTIPQPAARSWKELFDLLLEE